jgi:hypothetical protein
LESRAGTSVSVDLVENALLAFFLAAAEAFSSASMAANFIMASRNGFSFSIAGDGGDGLGEQRLLIPLDDSTIMDWTSLRRVASARRCASELLPFLRTTWLWAWLAESSSGCPAALSPEGASGSVLASAGVTSGSGSALAASHLATSRLASLSSLRAATLGDTAGGGLSQTELADDPHDDDDDDDSDVTPDDDVDDVRLSFVGSTPVFVSTVALSSEIDLNEEEAQFLFPSKASFLGKISWKNFSCHFSNLSPAVC